MQTPTFDLVEIVKVIQRNLKAILGITVVAAIIGLVMYKIKDKTYEANAEVYMLNPLFGDRNHILRRSNGDMRFVDYFGTEGDVDRGMTMIESKDVEDSVIAACNLYQTYKLDPAKPKDRAAMHQRYRSGFKAKRTENSSILCSYEDTDAERAAKVLDKIIEITDHRFRRYLSIVKLNSAKRVQKKIEEIDQQLALYTDSLIRLRDQYKIYDIISPARQNIIVGGISAGGKVNPGAGIELIQNVEAVKDQLLVSKTELTATTNELLTNNDDEVKLLYYVSSPEIPNKTSGLGLVLTVFACAFAAFFFCVLLFSFTSYIRALAQTER